MEDTNDPLNMSFTTNELNRALKKFKLSASGKDQICYVMVSNLSESSKNILLEMYNRIWEDGKLPKSWKEAVIIPIRKPGKDESKPENYRPVALTSNLCKIMERMINERLIYHMEKKGLISSYQSGFRRGRSTMDPVLCLEHEIRKAQVNKESVVAIFFDIERAYDMMWREGLLIKIRRMGMFRWVKNFLEGRQIQVKIRKDYSESMNIENGTPQSSIVSLLLFSVVVNDMFKEVEGGMGFSLFADDGAKWKRGRNLEFIIKKLQGAILAVEKWSYKWGFKLSVEKTKIMFFTRKRVDGKTKLKLYGQDLERVKQFKFLVMWFDERMTWGVHIKKIIDVGKYYI
uniref:Reverse transcriptase domain-containing protein n=1 Tax=Poecilia reticulata TaxID=8081 RepID=A0A3P9P5F4_POERE